MARAQTKLLQKARRKPLPLVGAAGMSLAFAGGASATAPTEHAPLQDTPRPVITLPVRRKSPTSTWRRSMSSTRKPSSSENAQLAR